MQLKTLIYKGIIHYKRKLVIIFQNLILKIQFWFLNVHYESVHTIGRPILNISINGKLTIGKNFKINNGILSNPIGCYERCTIVVENGASIIIGNNVGISQTALIAATDIIIKDNVKIGGGTCIWTTDFHSLSPDIRTTNLDSSNRATAPVIIKENAFIGGKSIILKGVTIGENSIIGAGSVVTKSIPDNQVWGGNPIKFIRNI